jgi:hypothetical protein
MAGCTTKGMALVRLWFAWIGFLISYVFFPWKKVVFFCRLLHLGDQAMQTSIKIKEFKPGLHTPFTGFFLSLINISILIFLCISLLQNGQLANNTINKMVVGRGES